MKKSMPPGWEEKDNMLYLSYKKLEIWIYSHDKNKITKRDYELAREINKQIDLS